MKRTTIALGFVMVNLARPSAARADEPPLDRRTFERLVLEAHPELRAADARARASAAGADAEGRLPAPEVMAQVWQIPLAKPYAVNQAGMSMFGLTQRFPAPGSLSAREDAKRHEARAAALAAQSSERAVRREAGHAFVEYAEATARRALHIDHERVERRLLELARARHAAGGSFADAVRAEAEIAKTEADVASAATTEHAARRQLNVLLGRSLDSPLGAAQTVPPEVPALAMEALLDRAAQSRAEPKIAEAEQRAAESELAAARKEAQLPSFAVSALYFPPSAAMDMHSYGASASVEVPWLWGGAKDRARAQEARAAAALATRGASRLPIRTEVVAAQSMVARAAERLKGLAGRALPASRRAVDVAAAGYESGGVPLAMVLEARRNLVDIQMEIVEARASLDHALVDLEAAVGAPITTQKVSETDSKEQSHGH
ncbi:MAG: TolC family protein [Myxococcales bacterium]|nr:TolC family protein [Myxococcales bacterium]